MVHIEAIDDLVVLVIGGWADVDDFPVQSTRELGEWFKGDVELEWREDIGWVVTHGDVVDMELSHLLICYFPLIYKTNDYYSSHLKFTLLQWLTLLMNKKRYTMSEWVISAANRRKSCDR